MSRIDSYLSNVDRLKATGLRLASNSPIVLKFPSGDRDATKKTSHSQLTHMIEEIAPLDAIRTLHSGQESSFVYQAPHGSYDFQVTQNEDLWTVLATPSPSSSTRSTHTALEERAFTGQTGAQVPRESKPLPETEGTQDTSNSSPSAPSDEVATDRQ